MSSGILPCSVGFFPSGVVSSVGVYPSGFVSHDVYVAEYDLTGIINESLIKLSTSFTHRSNCVKPG